MSTNPASGLPLAAVAVDQALARLGSRPEGLSAAEAEQRLRQYGPNRLPAPARPSALRRFGRQFQSALIWFLIASAAIAAVLGQVVDAGVIAAVVVINALIGFFQEGRAEQALDAIRQMVSPTARVRRGGQPADVPAETLVPGDIVVLEAGDRVPADLRLLEAQGLSIDEAALTGESVAASKGIEPVAPDAPLGERHSMAHSGTLVASGRGLGMVAATGTQTEIGHIARMIGDVEELSTPLLAQINRFARSIAIVAAAVAIGLFLFAVFVRELPWVEALVGVVALAVGFIPEGLPAAITITLAVGVKRMAGHMAVVRKLPAVETLGSVSVICTDKTGTLTRNEMMVERLQVQSGLWRVSGDGYRPEGELRPADGASADRAAVNRLIACGLLCNDAGLEQKQGQWKAVGDPMEAALLALARKAGTDAADLRARWPRVAEIPFDARWRYMATLHRASDGRGVVLVKGAPEAVLALADPADRGMWADAVDTAAAAGERVLAFAMARLDEATDRLEPDMLQNGLELLGIAGLIDPPRSEARAAIAECRSAGIAVKMITGDHALTACAIARQLDLADDPQALTGAEIDALSDAELADRVGATAIFARASPEHKIRIVRALQRGGAFVAMTGDGVNDAPSLKQADIGVAMGAKGTAAAREAAQIVLLDDNFATIVHAVEQGRIAYDNVRKLITWMLPTDGGEVIGVVLAILAGFTLPLSATQILWVNLVTSLTLGLAIAFEPAEPGVMRRPPRPRSEPLLSRYMLWRLVLVSLLIGGASLATFFAVLGQSDDLPLARTMTVNMIAILEAFYLINARWLHRTPGWNLLAIPLPMIGSIVVVLLLQALFTYAPFMQRIFHTHPLAAGHLVVIATAGVGMVLLLEVEKRIAAWTGWFPELRQ